MNAALCWYVGYLVCAVPAPEQMVMAQFAHREPSTTVPFIVRETDPNWAEAVAAGPRQSP